jgi:hypothetical protein
MNYKTTHKRVYNIPSKHIWFNPITNEATDKRTSKEQIKFDSKAEFDLYRKLQPLCQAFDIALYKDAKLTFDNVNWLVDFKLVFPLKMLPLVNDILGVLKGSEVTTPIPIIYIEYKGVATDATILKLDAIQGTDYQDNIILCSQNAIGYVSEDIRRLKTKTYTINSVSFLINLLNCKLLKY